MQIEDPRTEEPRTKEKIQRNQILNKSQGANFKGPLNIGEPLKFVISVFFLWFLASLDLGSLY